MTEEFDFSELGISDQDQKVRNQIHKQIREWARERGYPVFTDEDHQGRLKTTIKIGEFRKVHIDATGGVELVKRNPLSGSEGKIRLTDSSIVVEDGGGQRSIVNENSFPINK